jgi:replicative DNA helicase
LRDSGDLEADTDVVLFLFREHYYLKNDPKITPDILSVCENKLEVNVAKQRMGPTGLIELYCHMGASAIRGLEDRDRQPMHALSTIDAREF